MLASMVCAIATPRRRLPLGSTRRLTRRSAGLASSASMVEVRWLLPRYDIIAVMMLSLERQAQSSLS